jgi:hypothetical protein
MFDLRYHVASLAAVFLALAVGILLGIGVADRGLIESTSERLLEARIADLERNLDAANAQIGELRGSDEAATVFAEEVYPTVVDGRLADKRIAVVFVGSVDAGLRDAIEDTLQDAGAPPVLRLRAFRVPLDEEAVRNRYGGAIDELGRSLGTDFVDGGETPLWDRLSSVIVEERVGAITAPADAVVVARPAEPQRGATALFLRGFYAGLAAAGVPVVGIDVTTSTRPPIESFQRAGLSTVDHLDTEAGHLSLALLLAGAQPGNYGVGESADDGVLPPLDSAPAPVTPE